VTSAIVIDASAGVEIALGTPVGLFLAQHVPVGVAVWAPDHYSAEVASAFRRIEVIERRLDGRRARRALVEALDLPTRRVGVRSLIESAWPSRFNITIGDALYVALARQLGCPLLTGDRRLASAPRLGVAMVTYPSP
jgi:predicted nucleic acid-binding protein